MYAVIEEFRRRIKAATAAGKTQEEPLQRVILQAQVEMHAVAGCRDSNIRTPLQIKSIPNQRVLLHARSGISTRFCMSHPGVVHSGLICVSYLRKVFWLSGRCLLYEIKSNSHCVAQATHACLRFLKEAALFYAMLVLKLQAAYGSVSFQLDFADQAALDAALGSVLLPPRAATLDCRISVYRCLICLGDLAR